MKDKLILLGLIITFISLLLPHYITVAESTPPYLKGNQFSDLRKEITLNNEDYVVFSTDECVYFLKDFEITFQINIKNVLFIEIIDDINANQYEEILIMTSSKDSDNIKVYDSKNLSLIYSYASTMKAYHFSLGYYDEVVPVDDYEISGSQGVFITGFKVFKLNFLTQNVIWEYVGNNNLWDIEPINDIDNDHVSDYMISIEHSDILTISGKTGKIIYQVYVSDPIYIKSQAIYTNIWSLAYDDAHNTVYAASENGYIYVINANNGEIEKAHEVAKLDIEYIKYYYGDKRRIKLYNFKLKLIDDLNNDGVKDVIYFQDEMGMLSILSGESLLNQSSFLRLMDDIELYGSNESIS